ncbi:hypothetical protein ZIOFF_006042 [Zingiber officinale]|uniref:LTI65/LTI78 PGEED repeat domain-containing protein n=1 Tax=Zingiber officinale TaxID=94328 RepID=A0A8J5HN88_ZINOF|nr:hypothetical protein ZIOFF_006042 [Zingiber officinale]
MAQSQRQRPDLDYQIGRQTLPSRNLQTHKGVSSPHTNLSAPTTPTSRHFYGYEYHDHHFENEKKSIIKRAKDKAKRWRYSILRRKSNKHENDNKPQVSLDEMEEQEIENHGTTNYGLTCEEDSSTKESTTIRYLSSNSNSTRITSQANGNWEIEMKQANDAAKQPSKAYNPPKDAKPTPSTANITRMDDSHMNQAPANKTRMDDSHMNQAPANKAPANKTRMDDSHMNQAPANITRMDNNNMNQAPSAAWSTLITNEHNNSEKMMLPPTTTISEYTTKMKTVNLETTTSTSIANNDNTDCETKTIDLITTSLPSTTNDHNTINEIVQEKLSPFTTSIAPISTSIVSGHKISSEKEMQSPITITSTPATYGYETIDEPLIDTLLSGTTTSTSIVSDHKNIDNVETLSPSPMSFGFVNDHKTIDEVETLSQSLMSFGSIVNGHKTIGETLIETLAPAYTMALEATLLIASKIQESCPRIENAKKQFWNRGLSMKEYLMNKLEPTEEDRLLCEVITKAMSLRKDFNRCIVGVGQLDTSKKGIVCSSVKEEKHDFNSPLPISTNPFIEDFEIRGRTH